MTALPAAALLILCVQAWAQPPAEGSEILRTINALNSTPTNPDLFTTGSDAPATLQRLSTGKRQNSAIFVHALTGGIGHGAILPMTSPNPRIVIKTIRFLSADVAMADTTLISEGAAQPLLILLKKDSVWKIASLRPLAP